MANIFIINAHEHYPYSEGRLNNSLVEKATEVLKAAGHEVRITTMQDDHDIPSELEKHRWADAVILQSPVNWMGVPWSFKKYMDLVYTAGMDGTLTEGDGRTQDDPPRQYGAGGTLTGTRYLLSLTFNAPKDVFDNPDEYLFQGKSVDDLFLPMHMNFRFFGMEPIETFACHDVVKNPDVSADIARFEAHLIEYFPGDERDEQTLQRAV